VVLTPKAFDALHPLVRNSGRLLEKDELVVKERGLSNRIFALRKAFGEDPTFIEERSGSFYGRI
jgi:DNA-binding winged helix-turn-helix (wHTH) protein